MFNDAQGSNAGQTRHRLLPLPHICTDAVAAICHEMNMTTKTPLLFGLMSLGLTCLLGCQSANQAGSMSHASVSIQGRSLADIQQTTTSVFREEGYALAGATPEQMVFQRPGTRRDALKWGGWAGQGVTIKVKVGMSRTLGGSYLLEAEAYAVQNSDDEFFRTERRNIMLNRRPYQKLLDEVARRLK